MDQGVPGSRPGSGTVCCGLEQVTFTSSIGVGLAPFQDGRHRFQDGRHGPKMAATTSDDPVTRSVSPRRVSKRPRPREGSVTS